MIEIYKMNLQFLVSKIEKEFNTLVNEYGVVNNEDEIYKNLARFNVGAEYLGYIVIPVDEDGEYLITRNSNNGYDESNFLDKFRMNNEFIPTENLKFYIQNEFKGRVYNSGLIRYSYAPNENRILDNMSDDDKFLYLYYLID